MKKKFWGMILCVAVAFNCVLPAMAQEFSVRQEINDIDNYMRNVIRFTHNPFSTENLLATNSLAETYNLQNQRNTVENKELAINEYDIEDCKQVYHIKEDFLSKLREGVVSINENDYSWYLPAENGEGRQSLIEFKERNNVLSVASLSISQIEHAAGFLADSEIQAVLEEKGVECTDVKYFNMPTYYGSAVCASIVANSGENYIMIVDNSMTEDFFEVGYLYSTSELYDVFTKQ